MKTDDISDTTELLMGGGGHPVVPARISVVLVEETKAGDTSRPECPCDDQERQPLAGGAVSEGDTRSPCWRGALPSSGTAGRLLPVDVTKTPTLSPSRISVVLVDGTMAGDNPGRECPREDGFWRMRAGKTRPAGVSVGGSDAGLPCVGKTLSSLDVAGRFRPVVPAGESSSVGNANPVGPDCPVVAGSPIGPCKTLSPLFHDALGPLEHSVPDETILGLDPLEHSGLDRAETILSRVEELLSSLDVAGRFRLVVPAGESSSVGTANPVGPMAWLLHVAPLAHVRHCLHFSMTFWDC